MINRINFFDQPVINDERTYDNIWKSTNTKGDDYTTGSLLDYTYLKKHYTMIVLDLRKQQALVANPKAMQQINFTGNFTEKTTIFFIIEEVKETIFNFSQGTVEIS